MAKSDRKLHEARMAVENPEQVSMREDALISEMNYLKTNIHSLEVALARCEGERDVYKELFTGGCNE